MNEVHQDDIAWHYSISCIVLNPKGKVLVLLNYMHNVNIVHKDLKSFNVLIHIQNLKPKIVVKISDFGCSSLTTFTQKNRMLNKWSKEEVEKE